MRRKVPFVEHEMLKEELAQHKAAVETAKKNLDVVCDQDREDSFVWLHSFVSLLLDCFYILFIYFFFFFLL
jgi:hypothetical protein